MSLNISAAMSSPSLPQYVVYDHNSFIADVGGYLGLFLGASIPSFYDIMVNFIGRITHNSGMAAKGRNGKSKIPCRVK